MTREPGEVTSHPHGSAAYFMLLLCMRLKLFRCRFVPLLEPNPGVKRSNFTLPYPDPLNAR